MATMPTIHLNGTSKRQLFEDYRNATHAVADAIDALRHVEFNARDYYPQGNEAWSAARDERAALFAKLEEVKAELEAITLHVFDHK